MIKGLINCWNSPNRSTRWATRVGMVTLGVVGLGEFAIAADAIFAGGTFITSVLGLSSTSAGVILPSSAVGLLAVPPTMAGLTKATTCACDGDATSNQAGRPPRQSHASRSANSYQQMGSDFKPSSRNPKALEERTVSQPTAIVNAGAQVQVVVDDGDDEPDDTKKDRFGFVNNPTSYGNTSGKGSIQAPGSYTELMTQSPRSIKQGSNQGSDQGSDQGLNEALLAHRV